MSITLNLRLIDHDRLVTQGLPVVNEANRTGNAEILRDYLTRLPIDVDPDVVEYHTRRLARLREASAPDVIIENEVRFLQRATGESYQSEAYRNASMDELRELLGTWCWQSHNQEIPLWGKLEWFLEPAAGSSEYPLDPIRPGPGDARQTLVLRALHGSAPYPVDDLGQPIIRTLGSPDPDCHGYNPPESCAAILHALRLIDPDDWSDHVPFREELYRRAAPGLSRQDVGEYVREELEQAREVFPVLLSVYSAAGDKGFGVGCEFTL